MLNKIKIFFNSGKRIFYGFIVVCCVLLVVSAVLRALTPPPPPAETIILSDKVFQTELRFKEDLSIKIPSRLSVFRANLPPDFNAYTLQFSKKLGMVPFDKFPNIYVDPKNGYKLMTENKEVIAYKKEAYLANNSADTPLNKDAMTQSLDNFIKTHGLFTNYTISAPQPQAITSEMYIDEPDETKADAFKYEIRFLLDGIPFHAGTIEQTPGLAWLARTGDILRINFYPVPTTFEKIDTYGSLGLENVKENMKKGIVTYLKASNEDIIEPTAKSLQYVDFSSVTIEYRQNEENGYILPYLHFKGTGKDQANKTYNVEAISPAVRVE